MSSFKSVITPLRGTQLTSFPNVWHFKAFAPRYLFHFEFFVCRIQHLQPRLSNCSLLTPLPSPAATRRWGASSAPPSEQANVQLPTVQCQPAQAEGLQDKAWWGNQEGVPQGGGQTRQARPASRVSSQPRASPLRSPADPTREWRGLFHPEARASERAADRLGHPFAPNAHATHLVYVPMSMIRALAIARPFCWQTADGSAACCHVTDGDPGQRPWHGAMQRGPPCEHVHLDQNAPWPLGSWSPRRPQQASSVRPCSYSKSQWTGRNSGALAVLRAKRGNKKTT